jgi:hypothetical protein
MTLISPWGIPCNLGTTGGCVVFALIASGGRMAINRIEPDLEDGDELESVVKETSRGGNEPPPEMNDRPEQNIGYDEAAKGRPLTAEERDRAKRESPLSD